VVVAVVVVVAVGVVVVVAVGVVVAVLSLFAVAGCSCAASLLVLLLSEAYHCHQPNTAKSMRRLQKEPMAATTGMADFFITDNVTTFLWRIKNKSRPMEKKHRGGHRIKIQVH
jgi:ABC-type transport system involved in cytochrome bd biosynthesis fused ATPase/permease subunit